MKVAYIYVIYMSLFTVHCQTALYSCSICSGIRSGSIIIRNRMQSSVGHFKSQVKIKYNLTLSWIILWLCYYYYYDTWIPENNKIIIIERWTGICCHILNLIESKLLYIRPKWEWEGTCDQSCSLCLWLFDFSSPQNRFSSLI